jgi:hypothetical protein
MGQQQRTQQCPCSPPAQVASRSRHLLPGVKVVVVVLPSLLTPQQLHPSSQQQRPELAAQFC